MSELFLKWDFPPRCQGDEMRSTKRRWSRESIYFVLYWPPECGELLLFLIQSFPKRSTASWETVTSVQHPWKKKNRMASFLFTDRPPVNELHGRDDWNWMFFTFFLSRNAAAARRCSLIFMNNCLGWILAIALTFISPHGTSWSVSQRTPSTTDPGGAPHRNIILHSAAKKEVLTSALL